MADRVTHKPLARTGAVGSGVQRVHPVEGQLITVSSVTYITGRPADVANFGVVGGTASDRRSVFGRGGESDWKLKKSGGFDGAAAAVR